MRESVLSRPVFGQLGFKSLMALAGMMGPIILIMTDFAAGFSDPGYSFIRNSISTLAWTRLGWLQTMGFIAIGLLIEVFAAGLYFSIKRRKGFRLGLGLLACFGIGLVIIGVCHTDPAAGPYTLAGSIHGQATKYTLWLFAAAALLIAPTLLKDPYWKPLFIYSIAAAVFAIGFMIGNTWRPHDLVWYGLFERILGTNEIIWVEIMAIWLLRQSIRENAGINGIVGIEHKLS